MFGQCGFVGDAVKSYRCTEAMITAITEAIKQRESISSKIKYFQTEFDMDDVNKDTECILHTINVFTKQMSH